MCEMLKHRLDTAVDPPPSWEAVVTALKSPFVDKKNIAELLESLSTADQYNSAMPHASSIPAPESLATSEQHTVAGPLSLQVMDLRSHHLAVGVAGVHLSATQRGIVKHPFPQQVPSTILTSVDSLMSSSRNSGEGFGFESRLIMMWFQELVSATIKSLIR